LDSWDYHEAVEKAYFTFKACTDPTQQSWRDKNGMKGIVMSERGAFKYAVMVLFEEMKKNPPKGV
jgi:hypothetical protein